MKITNEKELKEYLLNGGLASNLHLIDVDLSKANLTGLDLNGIRLTRVDLKGAILEDVDMTNAICVKSDFSYAGFICAKCVNSKFNNCDFKGTVIRHSWFLCSEFMGSDLAKTQLAYSSFINSVFIKSTLDRSIIRYSCLNGSCFDHSSLFNASFYGSNLVGAILNNAVWLDKAEFTLSNMASTLLEVNEKIRTGLIITEPMIGFKKCRSTLEPTLSDKHVIVELEIPAGAIVFSINNDKCRTNKAIVKRIHGGDRGFSTYGRYLSYYVGDEINVKDFNLEYNVECGTGVHFFRTYEEAESYKT